MTHQTNCESLVDRGARPCTCTPRSPIAELSVDDVEQIAREYRDQRERTHWGDCWREHIHCAIYKLAESHRALAQRLQEAEARLSTVIRVSQEYASETAQAQQRIAQLEGRLDAEHTKPAKRQDSVIRNAHGKHDANNRLGGDRGL